MTSRHDFPSLSMEKILDEAYAKMVRVFSFALKELPAPDQATRGIASILSSGCGGSGIVYLTDIDMRTKFARELSKWIKKNPNVDLRFENKTLSFYLKSDPRIYAIPDNMRWAQAQCTEPQSKAYRAFMDHLKENGVEIESMWLRIINN